MTQRVSRQSEKLNSEIIQIFNKSVRCFSQQGAPYSIPTLCLQDAFKVDYSGDRGRKRAPTSVPSAAVM